MCEQMSCFAFLGEAGTPTQAEWLAQVMHLLNIVGQLTIRPVALDGEGSNCFSIIQQVEQKRQ